MAHEPRIIRKVPEQVSLTVCGHTHGGQVSCFGYTPVSGTVLGKNKNYGHVVYTGGRSGRGQTAPKTPRHMIISGGLGCSFLPVRFGVPPEITMVHLGERRHQDLPDRWPGDAPTIATPS